MEVVKPKLTKCKLVIKNPIYSQSYSVKNTADNKVLYDAAMAINNLTEYPYWTTVSKTVEEELVQTWEYDY